MSLAAVTCLFGHQGGERLANWCHVAGDLQAAGVDLWTVEASFPGQAFALPEGPRVLRYACDCDQVVWQKERLLNLAVAQLPAEVDAIAWVDSDVLFDCCELAWAIEHVLQACPVAQLWQYAVLLGPDGRQQAWPHGVRVAESIAAHNYGRQDRCQAIDVTPQASHPGFAWAMRREAWDAMGGLYELDLGGVADGVMAAAWLGAGAANPYLRWASAAMRADALAWGERAYGAAGGRVGYLPIAIGHLWHGPIQARQYARRTRKLAKSGYDPQRHVSRESGRPLRWTAEAPSGLVSWWRQFLGP
jgi:hypothetical protein